MGSQGGFFESVSDQQHADERCWSRTAKSCGPDAPTLASSPRSCVGPTGLRQNKSADDGGKRARSPGRVRHKPLKPLRRECRVFRGTCGFYPCAFYLRTGGCGCSGHPAFPAPSSGERIHAQLGRIASRREREVVCRLAVIARSEATKQSI